MDLYLLKPTLCQGFVFVKFIELIINPALNHPASERWGEMDYEKGPDYDLPRLFSSGRL